MSSDEVVCNKFFLKNTTLIIEGAMQLHNFLVDYINANCDSEGKGDKALFQEDIDDTSPET